jgi:hypothetical protein
MTVTVVYKSAALQCTTSMADVRATSSTSGVIELVTDLRVANRDGASSASITIAKTDASNTILAYLAYQIPIPAGMSLVVVSGLLALASGEKIRALSSSNSTLDVNYSGRQETTT